MNFDSWPRLSRGTTDPASADATFLAQLGPTIPLLAYLARILGDTMCDHTARPLSEAMGLLEPNLSICDRCTRLMYEVGCLIDRSADAVADWSAAARAELDARMALAAAERLRDLFNADAPVLNGVDTLTIARRAVEAGRALLDDPDLGRMNDALRHVTACSELDTSTYRASRKRGMVQESRLIGFVLKAAGKAAEAAAFAVESRWATTWTDPTTSAERTAVAANAKNAENSAGASIGAALDGAVALVGTSKPSALMAIASAVANAFERAARPEDRTNGVDAPASLGGPAEVTFPAEGVVVGGVWYGSAEAARVSTEETGDVDDFEDDDLADVADEAIGDAAALAADLERAERILSAIAEEHRPVEHMTRTVYEAGFEVEGATEHYQNVCVVCRDGDGRPMPSPCRTMRIVQSRGEL